MIIYRSFYEAIKELPIENQWEIYDAIFSFWLDFKEPKLNWISKTIRTLIKPQIEANQVKYTNWRSWGRPKKKPKHNLNITKKKPKHNLSITQAKGNVNVNVNVNEEWWMYNASSKDDVAVEKKLIPQTTALADDIPPTDKHNKEWDVAFEKFWKAYPHARKAKKSESKKHFIKQDHNAVMEEVMYLNLKIEFWLQEWKYVPACERWIRDFIITADNVKQNELKEMVDMLMKLPVWDDRSQKNKALMWLFWEEKIKELVKARNKKRSSIDLIFN